MLGVIKYISFLWLLFSSPTVYAESVQTLQKTVGEVLRLENEKLLSKARAEEVRTSQTLPTQMSLPIDVNLDAIPNTTSGLADAVKKRVELSLIGIYGVIDQLWVLLDYKGKQKELKLGDIKSFGTEKIKLVRVVEECVIVELNKRSRRLCMS